MKARLLAVQRTLWMLILASLVVGVLAFPRGRNRDYMAALEELTAFRAGFKQHELETSLLGYAHNQGLVRVDDVAKRVAGPSVPALRAKPGAQPVLPLAKLDLSTLQAVLDRTVAAGSVEIGVPAAAQIADAIAWRLVRSNASANQQIASIKLLRANPTAEEVSLDADVAKARLAALDADAAFAKATTTLTAAEDLFDARRKWKAPWKAILKADQARREAKAALAERKAAVDSTHARYETLAKRAEAFKMPDKPAAVVDATRAVAEVVIEPAAGQSAKPHTFYIPVSLDVRKSPVPALQGTTFTATRAADLWDEVKDQTPDAAVTSVRKHFTWQYQYVELGGLKFGGMTLLHILPLIMPGLLLWLVFRMRRVSVTYNPFGPADEGHLPRVGLGGRALELASLAVLPTAASVLAIIALSAVAQLPILPMLCALASLGLGYYAHVELGSLQSLIEAVARAHSAPPKHAQ